MVKSKVLPVVHYDWPSIYHLQELGEFLQIVFSQIGTAINHGRPNQLSFCRIRKNEWQLSNIRIGWAGILRGTPKPKNTTPLSPGRWVEPLEASRLRVAGKTATSSVGCRHLPDRKDPVRSSDVENDLPWKLLQFLYVWLLMETKIWDGASRYSKQWLSITHYP